MTAAYTLLNNEINDVSGDVKSLNITSNIHATSAEGVLLFIVALAGGIGNIIVLIIPLVCSRLRQMSTAFLFHHCLLDIVKSGFCFPFGYSLLHNTDISHCDIIGASYIFLMTLSAYNLLALLVNEEYQCSFHIRKNEHQKQDGCCIAFGVIITWFTTVLLQLGVIFLPGSSEFSKDIGYCVYKHGVTKNYVIHTLWVILVTGAIIVAAVSFFKFFRKLQSSVQSRKWTFLHKSLSSLSRHNANDNINDEVHYHFDDVSSQKTIQLSQQYLRRIMIMMSMVTSFVVCWYPLFILTLIDINYVQPPHIYRKLMILAWAHPVTTPFFCGIIYYDTFQSQKMTKDVYTNAIPMTRSRSGEAIRQEINHMHLASGVTAFHNENFQFTLNHESVSPSHSYHESVSPSHSYHESVSPPHSHHEIECESSQCNNAMSNFDTIVNYNSDEGRYQTLIM